MKQRANRFDLMSGLPSQTARRGPASLSAPIRSRGIAFCLRKINEGHLNGNRRRPRTTVISLQMRGSAAEDERNKRRGDESCHPPWHLPNDTNLPVGLFINKIPLPDSLLVDVK